MNVARNDRSQSLVQIKYIYVYAYNPSTQEAETEKLNFWGQIGLWSKTLSRNGKVSQGDN